MPACTLYGTNEVADFFGKDSLLEKIKRTTASKNVEGLPVVSLRVSNKSIKNKYSNVIHSESI